MEAPIHPPEHSPATRCYQKRGQSKARPALITIRCRATPSIPKRATGHGRPASSPSSRHPLGRGLVFSGSIPHTTHDQAHSNAQNPEEAHTQTKPRNHCFVAGGVSKWHDWVPSRGR